MKRILIVAIAAFVLTSSVDAAGISHSCSDQSCNVFNFLLRGEIAKGDYEKVKSQITPFTSVVKLVSPGGDVDEALKIGRLFRKHLITTGAPRRQPDGSFREELCRGQNCTCVSACALIWFGGVARIGTVGVHRPYTNDPMFRGLPPEDASREYRRMLNNVTVYLNEMEVPRSIIELMEKTPSGDIRWVDGFDDGLERPPSIAEWVDASCGRGDPLAEALRQDKKLSPQQWNSLHDQYSKKLECEAFLFLKRRPPMRSGG